MELGDLVRRTTIARRNCGSLLLQPACHSLSILEFRRVDQCPKQIFKCLPTIADFVTVRDHPCKLLFLWLPAQATQIQFYNQLLIVFYLEPLSRHGYTIDEFPDGGPVSAAFDELSAGVVERSLASFEIIDSAD